MRKVKLEDVVSNCKLSKKPIIYKRSHIGYSITISIDSDGESYSTPVITTIGLDLHKTIEPLLKHIVKLHNKKLKQTSCNNSKD
jgi:hypothetical protein